MNGTDRSAAGPAAGYHFQIQRALLSLLTGPSDRQVSIETLDDIVDADTARGAVTFEQLKHSLRPGTLTDRSRPLWKALDAWMDLLSGGLDGVHQLELVTTDHAPAGSAAALLRADDGLRSPTSAEARLLDAAGESPGSADTRACRERFAALDPADRGRLLAKVVVRDGTAGVHGFRDQLLEAVGLGVPRDGVSPFLDQIVGWWERRAVDLLVGRRSSIRKEEAADEIARIRDSFSGMALPQADADLTADIDIAAALLRAYKGSAFVVQLRLVAAREERLRIAIRDYHRAFTQRSRWLQNGILAPDELGTWERRLIEEWDYARQRMLDELGARDDDESCNAAGLALLGKLEESALNPLRDSAERFIRVGTLHGLADVHQIGWHPDFLARLEALLGGRPAQPSLDEWFKGYSEVQA